MFYSSSHLGLLFLLLSLCRLLVELGTRHVYVLAALVLGLVAFLVWRAARR